MVKAVVILVCLVSFLGAADNLKELTCEQPSSFEVSSAGTGSDANTSFVSKKISAQDKGHEGAESENQQANAPAERRTVIKSILERVFCMRFPED